MSVNLLRCNNHNSGAVVRLPLYGTVKAGFPSPADDYLEQQLSLNELLISHPSATYFCRVSGDSMIQLGIFDGDILIVDRSLEPVHNDVVIATIDGEFTCKRLDLDKRRLLAANNHYPPISVSDGLVIEGVVTSSIRRHRCSL